MSNVKRQREQAKRERQQRKDERREDRKRHGLPAEDETAEISETPLEESSESEMPPSTEAEA